MINELQEQLLDLKNSSPLYNQDVLLKQILQHASTMKFKANFTPNKRNLLVTQEDI